MIYTKQCPRCGGDLYDLEDWDREVVLCCLQCGNRIATIRSDNKRKVLPGGSRLYNSRQHRVAG